MKPEYISCPLKTAVKLCGSTNIFPVPLTDSDKLNYAAHFIDLGMNLKELMEHLSCLCWKPSTGVLQSQLINLAGKISSLSEQKTTDKAGNIRKVATLELIDGTNSLVEIAVWDKAYASLIDIPVGTGITIVGCSATSGKRR